jgi:hypothetical protein
MSRMWPRKQRGPPIGQSRSTWKKPWIREEPITAKACSCSQQTRFAPPAPKIRGQTNLLLVNRKEELYLGGMRASQRAAGIATGHPLSRRRFGLISNRCCSFVLCRNFFRVQNKIKDSLRTSRPGFCVKVLGVLTGLA